MSDVVFVLLGVALFGLLALYVLACDRLQGAEAEAVTGAPESTGDGEPDFASSLTHTTNPRAGR